MKRAYLRASCALLFLAAGASSCAAVDDKTQITVALESETEIPQELDAFSVRVFSTRTGELRFAKEYFPQSGREFPTTLAVVPLDENSLANPIRVELEGGKDGRVFLRRQAVVSYFRERNILLTMPLRMACFQFKSCGPTETCSGGQCVDARVDAGALPDFDPKYVFGQEGACFDEERCLGASARVEVAEDCTFPLPDGVSEGDGNISIRWDAAPARLLALEADDAQEGWTRLAPNTGRLSQGACDSHFRRLGPDGEPLVPDWAREVLFSATCPSKTKTLPYCFSQRTQHAGIGAIAPPE